jgi:predicted transcriptional regulator of viral defense system
MKTISLKRALSNELSDRTEPVITYYDLGVMVYNSYVSQQYQGKKIQIKKYNPGKRELNNAIKNLEKDGILEQIKNIRSVYKIFGKKFDEKVFICSANPFSYISHLSAMEFHGLTDKIPRVLIYSTPDTKTWRELALKKTRKDYNEKIKEVITPLTNIRVDKIGKISLIRFSSIHFGSYINIKNKALRVSSIGRTFLDMVRKPELCGGIYNVLDAYMEFAKRYLNLILDEINRNGNKIEKVRAGYILEERCDIKNNPILESWKTFAQRGGSRKLDPDSEYDPEYSETWCLSINIEG